MDSNKSSENSYATTPLKSEGSSFVARHQLYSRNSNPYKTPMRNTTEPSFYKSASYRSVIIEKMPIYSPPPKTVSFVKNPFEHERFLKQRLSQPICSPSLFKAVSSPKQDDDFTWSIEDISVLNPADIDENPSQDFDSWFSPTTESEAQEAINRFFSSHIVGMESPVVTESKKKNKSNNCSDGNKPLTLDTWSQTDLSLPPILPPDVEAILSSYCIFNTDQKDQDELNNSNSSRKKLLFRDFTCTSPQFKVDPIVSTSVSTPITSRLSSPELSPVSEASPMDISVCNRSAIRLNLNNDIEMNEKENLEPKDWNLQGCSTPRALVQSCDSAFASL